MKYKLKDITLLVLAGGKGSRLHGQDKGLIKLVDKFLVEYILQTAAPCLDNILISANRNQSQYRAFGYPVVSDSLLGDTVPPHAGPLAGMLTGIQNCKTALMATLPCDTPLVGGDYFEQMLESLNNGETSCCVAYSGEHMQPLHNIVHVDCGDNLSGSLQNGMRRVKEWITPLNPSSCRFAENDRRFININTPEELDKLASEIRDEHHK